MHTLEIELGWLYLAPGPRHCYHLTTNCPTVTPDYPLPEPGDDGYTHIIRVLGEYEWCTKFQFGLVDPLREGSGESVATQGLPFLFLGAKRKSPGLNGHPPAIG